eukprot:123103_1
MNSSINDSATYNLLITMGFSPLTCRTATKIYLNDIEQAVNYCTSSDVSSSDSSPMSSIMNRKGANYIKCLALLESLYPQYLSLFESWYHEDEFEDDQLVEEFVENSDFTESFFIQYLEEHTEGIPFSDHTAMQLFTHLSDAMQSADHDKSTKPCPHHLMDGYIRRIESQLNTQYKHSYPLFAQIPFKKK